MDGSRDPGWVVDARERVTGELPFTSGLTLPGMLHARLVRSAVAHGRIRSIDVSVAKTVPGVVAVLTGADLVAWQGIDPWYGPVFRDQPALAIDIVRYVGEPVAAIAALDLDAARAAADAVVVEIDELPAVFEPDAALSEGAPLVHESLRRAGTYSRIDGQPESNVCHHFKIRKGSLDEALAAAVHVFEDTFTTPAIQHTPLETHVCVARPDGRRLTVWSSTQTPFGVRLQLAEMLGRPQSSIRLLVPPIGGAYGSKGHAKIEPITVLLALAANRPVKLHLERAEEFITITKHAATVTLTTALDGDGRILGRGARCLFNTGAYADIGPRVVHYGGMGATGPYRVDNVSVDSLAVYTNTPTAGAFRGFGFPQLAWAHESQMDMIAERLGADPIDLRLANVIHDGDAYATGESMSDCYYGELLENAARELGASRRAWDVSAPSAGRREVSSAAEGCVRGVGFAVTTKATIVPSISSATAKLNDDGSLTVLAASVDMGQAVTTALARMAADQLGLDPRLVEVTAVDTDASPFDFMTSASRSTFAMGAAVEGAVREVRDQLIALAADQMEIAADDLELVAGRVEPRGARGTGRPIAAVVKAALVGNLLGRGTYRRMGGLDPETGQGVGSVHWSPGVGAAEVEVDLATGIVRLLRYHAGTYAGRIVNPVPAELQLEGCVSFGVGQALFEELVFDQGQLQNGTLADYLVCGIRDMPESLTLNVLERPDPPEIHGLGEAALPPVMPAIANAVFDATGVRILDLPITPEKVLRGLAELRGGKSDGG